MNVDYNKFASTFSKSRKNMKWEELNYFIDNYLKNSGFSLLDIWCGNGRLLSHLNQNLDDINFDYVWCDASSLMIEEAKNIHKNDNFYVLNMLNLEEFNIWKKFDFIVFIASFHHLDSFEDRELVLDEAKKLLKKDWIIFMTNWSLDSDLNYEKYINSRIENSINEYGSSDYNIKIWEFDRYYHCFNLNELNTLFKKTWFDIIENRLFDNSRNIISVIKKIWD